MNNVQKAFKMKSKLRMMADGGPALGPQALGSGMAARVATQARGRRARLDEAIDGPAALPPPAPVAPPATPTPAAKKPEGGKSLLRDFFGFADGGMAPPEKPLTNGGKVVGKGGPTDDKVGPVALSAGEYVLPADTVEIVGRDNLEKLRLATHDFSKTAEKPKAKSGLRAMAEGGDWRTFYVDDRGTATRGQMPPGRAMVPYQPPADRLPVSYQPPQAAAAPRPTPAPAPAPAAPATPAPAPAPTPAAAPSLAARAGSMLRAGARAAPMIGPLVGVRQSFNDLNTGYREDYNARLNPARNMTPETQSAIRGVGDALAPATGGASRAVAQFLSNKEAVGDTARTLTNVGDAALFGIPGRVGEGLRSAAAGESFTDGFARGSDRSQFMGANAAEDAPAATAPASASTNAFGGVGGFPAAPSGPAMNDFQRAELARLGVDAAQQNRPAPATEASRQSILRGTGTPGQFQNLGTYGGTANIYGTASEPGGRINTFVGVGPNAGANPGGPTGPVEDPMMAELRSALRAPRSGGGGGGFVPTSNARAINERFDKLAQQLSSMYGRDGQGNLARRMLELEAMRTSALNADGQTQATMRGQNMNAAASAAGDATQARNQNLQTVAGLMERQSALRAAQQTGQAAATAEQAKAQTADSKVADARANRAATSLVDYATRQFGEDSPEALQFENAFRATNPDFMTMPEGDRESLLAQFRETWESQRPIRERAATLGRPVPVGEIAVGAPSPVTFGDLTNNRATVGDWWESFNLLSPNDPTARIIPTTDGATNMLVSERDLITRRDGSKREDVISRLRQQEQ